MLQVSITTPFIFVYNHFPLLYITYQVPLSPIILAVPLGKKLHWTKRFIELCKLLGRTSWWTTFKNYLHLSGIYFYHHHFSHCSLLIYVYFFLVFFPLSLSPSSYLSISSVLEYLIEAEGTVPRAGMSDSPLRVLIGKIRMVDFARLKAFIYIKSQELLATSC